MPDVSDLANRAIAAGEAMIEQRLRDTLERADASVDDLRDGRVVGERRTNNYCECRGSGILTRISATTITVELCSCLEIIVTRQLANPFGGDGFVHV